MGKLKPSSVTPASLAKAREVLQIEARAITELIATLDAAFDRAVQIILNCTGRVVVSGMGKSGHIARKIASTLASTGTPAFFVHPAEASHGDLGMVTPADAVVALSNSGETFELADILNYTRRWSIPLIAITSRGDSALGSAADVTLLLPNVGEAGLIGIGFDTNADGDGAITWGEGPELEQAALGLRDAGEHASKELAPALARLGARGACAVSFTAWMKKGEAD